MTAVEYLEAKKEHFFKEEDFIQDFYRWIWTWGQEDYANKTHWKQWTKEYSVKFVESPLIGDRGNNHKWTLNFTTFEI